MGKRTMTQRSFARGVVRPEYLERDDLQARGQSLQAAENVTILLSGAAQARQGSTYLSTRGQAVSLDYITPADGVSFALMLGTSNLKVIDMDGVTVFEEPTVPWPDGVTPWIARFGSKTYIGAEFGIYVLDYNDGTWTWEAFAFAVGPGGEVAQPYWVFDPESPITMQPSALTGSITLTASDDFFTAGYVGLRMRYGKREIEITAFTDAQHVTGTVISDLPPTYILGVDNVTGARLGDAVVGQDTDFQGIITAIGVSTITVATLDFFDGPDIAEVVNWPNGGAAVSTKTTTTPAASDIWDEPLMSEVRGFPRAGTSASGRLILTDHPQVPSAVIMSSVRAPEDFLIGIEDDDGIARTFGDNVPRFLHAVNAGDLLLLSDRGSYYIPMRDSGVLTPSTVSAVRLDERGCNGVKPVTVGGAVAFVSSAGTTIYLAALDGNIYLKWSVRSVTGQTDAVKTVASIAGPVRDATIGETMFFVINTDGTAAALTWDEGITTDSMGFIPWTTEGNYIAASAIGPDVCWFLVDRVIDGSTIRCLEEMDAGAALDCQVPIDDAALFNGQSVHVYGGGYYLGERTVSGGVVPDTDGMPAESFAGFNFVASLQPWPAEVTDSPRAGMINPRIVQGSVSVQGTGVFQVRANNTTKTFGGYAAGDDLSEPAPLRTWLRKFIVVGRRDHPEIEVIKPYPGDWRVLAVTQEVHY